MLSPITKLKRRAAASTLFFCLLILAASQMLIPASRVADMMAAGAASSELTVVNDETAPVDDNSAAAQLQHCVMVKLTAIRMGTEVPLPANCRTMVFGPVTDAVPAGLQPGVLTPPPRQV